MPYRPLFCASAKPVPIPLERKLSLRGSYYNKMQRILVINPGSTSTKIALYEAKEGEAIKNVFTRSIVHSEDELKQFSWVMEQLDYRYDCIINTLFNEGVELSSLTCVVSRGGMIPPCASGAYRVNDAMIQYMMESKIDTHISNVGCAVAYRFEKALGIPSYIYDPVTVDELDPIARITGLPELPKVSRGHALNSHAMAHRCARDIMHKPLSECTFIVQHLGGGCSVWLFKGGRAIDMYSDDDAGFAPERCGKLQAMNLIKLCYSGKYTLSEMTKKVRGNAGLRAHLGTSNAVEVEKMIESGNEHAKLVYEALAYGVAKGIGDLATAVCGKVDRIILTGGLSHSNMLTGWIKKRVEFIAPVEIMAGEFEMEALAEGALRVMCKQEMATEFSIN